MIFTALLRGINVGGNNKVDMKKLKTSFESLGFEQVVTYINSGNVIFKTGRADIKNITTEIEAKIFADFGFKIKVLVREKADLKVICENVPESWINDTCMKCDVLFLWDEIDNSSVLNSLNLAQGVDTAFYFPGAVVWSLDRQNYNQSAMSKFVKSPVYSKMTARNINTVRKILDIMNTLS